MLLDDEPNPLDSLPIFMRPGAAPLLEPSVESIPRRLPCLSSAPRCDVQSRRQFAGEGDQREFFGGANNLLGCSRLDHSVDELPHELLAAVGNPFDAIAKNATDKFGAGRPICGPGSLLEGVGQASGVLETSGMVERTEASAAVGRDV